MATLAELITAALESELDHSSGSISSLGAAIGNALSAEIVLISNIGDIVDGYVDAAIAALPAHATEGYVDGAIEDIPAPTYDIEINHEEAYGVNGGSSVVGSNLRKLNTKIKDVNSICTLSGYKFKLPIGDYITDYEGITSGVREQIAYLSNDSLGGSPILRGFSRYGGSSLAQQAVATFRGEFTVTDADHWYAARQVVRIAVIDKGMGYPAAKNVNGNLKEIYATLRISPK